MKQLSIQNDLYSKTKTYPSVQTKQRVSSSNVFQRASEGDRTAIKECIANYGDWIWSMAKKFTDSTADAEAVTKEIFLNIWRYAARREEINFDELLFITIIARRQIRKYSERSNQTIN
jgi:DNA-directed RNA polymerase specialized sigma24 family protein